ncbi:hypothetical protein MLD38_015186 [Melastoma candidum]|uniref:Uncharacterized protein n=1 Tax=Melastoma candidum TaxID=119954 RepID=A0ACB9RJ02_9MYRT|nr:hypothetical protein MLD38_015186 [Melastoma candidum]
MWLARENTEKRGVGGGGGGGVVAVAIDRDKSSQYALKWAIDNLLLRGQTVYLVHVKLRTASLTPTQRKDLELPGKDIFLPFRCFCSRKDIQCRDVMLEDNDVARALIEYVNHNIIENLVVGAGTKSGFLRFKATDIPGTLTKGAPDFCSVYVIAKGKVTATRSASRPAPGLSPLAGQSLNLQTSRPTTPTGPPISPTENMRAIMKTTAESHRRLDSETDFIRSPFSRGKGANGKPYGECGLPDSDISFVSSGRPSVDRVLPSLYDNMDGMHGRLSSSSDIDGIYSFDNNFPGRRSVDTISHNEFSYASQDSDKSFTSSSPNVGQDDLEAEMKRLRMELKQTMEMYSSACKEALTAKQKAKELQRWKMEEQRRLEEARLAEETALAIAEKERAKSRAAIEHAEAAQRIAELEAQKRINAEMKALKEAEEKKRMLDALVKADVRYRKYSIEEIEVATNNFSESLKIGEGGYGPVYKGYLDHTEVAIKVLRPDAAQGRSQFLQEVEVLSCIRHPNMVLLLGACPEYGCLVYEYMANGSLEDRLLRRGNTPPLSWQLRFKIAFEIGTCLMFLHQTKPEPLVHRDLKPANILLDRNFVSKIADVGLARLVPPSVAENVTQYRMTSTAGTFCYIDPEYQQTGMLGVKSDIYSLGIIFLQMITARSPMGLTHHVERAIEKGNFADLLDQQVRDWPMEETTRFAKMALKCSELRRKDRPDLGKVILPELDKLRTLAEESMQTHFALLTRSSSTSPVNSQVSLPLSSLSNTSMGASEGSSAAVS